MSLKKAINHGKEHRKPYYQSKRFDPTCRPGGSCPYCRANRLHSTRKRERKADYREEEYGYEEEDEDEDYERRTGQG